MRRLTCYATKGSRRRQLAGVAARAACNQGLIFYHFGSLVDLLLAALDEVSAQRRQRYEEALATVRSPEGLVDLAARIFAEDLDTGDAAVLVEMIAGSASTPGLAAAVKSRMTPWAEFAEAALRPVLEDSPLGRAVAPARSPTLSSRSTWALSCSLTWTVTAPQQWRYSTTRAVWRPSSL